MAAVPSLTEEHEVVTSIEEKKKNRPVKHTCINRSPTVTNILISKLMWVIHAVKFTPYSTDFSC
jgi:hypothetical protein